MHNFKLREGSFKALTVQCILSIQTGPPTWCGLLQNSQCFPTGGPVGTLYFMWPPPSLANTPLTLGGKKQTYIQ